MALPKYIPKERIDKLIELIENTYQQLEEEINSLPSQMQQISSNASNLDKSDTTTTGTERKKRIYGIIDEMIEISKRTQQEMRSMGGKPKVNIKQEYYIDTSDTQKIKKSTVGPPTYT